MRWSVRIQDMVLLVNLGDALWQIRDHRASPGSSWLLTWAGDAETQPAHKISPSPGEGRVTNPKPNTYINLIVPPMPSASHLPAAALRCPTIDPPDARVIGV